VAVLDAVPVVAVMVAMVVLVTALVITVKVAVVDPAGTVTLDGTVAFVLLLLSDTLRPPAGAGPVNVTVPVELVPPLTDAGLSVSELRVAATTVNVLDPDVPPPGTGLVTVIPFVVAAVVSDAGIMAASEVDDIYVVSRAVPLALATLAGTKLVPVSVNVTAPVPATVDVGLMLLNTGIGFADTVKFRLFEVPPPGAALVTDTAAVPVLAMFVAGTAAVN